MADLVLPPKLEQVVWENILDDLLELKEHELLDDAVQAVIARHALRAMRVVDVLQRKTPKLLDGNLVVRDGQLTLLRPK